MWHHRLASYSLRDFYHEGIEDDVKITCKAVQEKGYDLAAELALDNRSSELKLWECPVVLF